MTTTPPPTAEQLDHLLGTTDRRRLTAEEAAFLRAGVRQLRASLAGAGAAVRRAPTGAYHQQVVRRAEQAEARIADLTPHIERLLAATGRMVEHWADAASTDNTEWRNDMWTELHQSADALAATLAGDPLPLNIPDGACGAYAPRHGAVCARPKDHTEAYHRDAKDRVYWLVEAGPGPVAITVTPGVAVIGTGDQQRRVHLQPETRHTEARP
ncbi:hypothetical protein ACFC58_36320 [Kitasatospora purpeofusca]|uniref:hypothetical protein n=1 Tax=Kitasatospora purpeofusca TaxID=67352 RepID=UPI0035E286CD